jgi:hypothetical protein
MMVLSLSTIEITNGLKALEQLQKWLSTAEYKMHLDRNWKYINNKSLQINILLLLRDLGLDVCVNYSKLNKHEEANLRL